MLSAMPRRSASKLRSNMNRGGRSCGCAITEKGHRPEGSQGRRPRRTPRHPRQWHERAKLVGGKLAVWSELDCGAEIELTIPGSVAYPKKTTDKAMGV